MTFRPALALVALVATTATAQRVSFPSFTGPGAASVRNQIVGSACDTADCVAATKTTTAGKPDWKKAKRESVQFFVTGSVVKRGKALTLDLFVFNKAGAPKAKRSFPLDKNGTLSGKNLQGAMDLMSGAFGSKRILNGQPRNQHNGEDIAASLGTPVKATNDGVVRMVDDHFFSGKGVILDHGLGLFTMYFHLDTTAVKEGERVKRGDVIGTVGKSGRATGPHLHWGAWLNGSRVNPFALARLSFGQP